MTLIQDSAERKHNDLIDIIIEGSQRIEEIENEEGHKVKSLVLDPETIYWKTHIVNSPTLARFVFVLKEFERLSQRCFDNMCRGRALGYSASILDIVKNFRYSVDSKSSESLRDKHNTQSTLIDKINKNKIEKAYTLSGDAKKSFADGLFGREEEKDRD
jgi:hypothetical protein